MLTWLTTDWSLLAEHRWTGWFLAPSIDSASAWELDYWAARLKDYLPQQTTTLSISSTESMTGAASDDIFSRDGIGQEVVRM